MKAVGYYHPHPIDHADALLDLELPDPQAGERDLLVEIKAISVNPVDVKQRQHLAPLAGQVKVLGWDATGVVRAVGNKVQWFKPGDRVWYAGEATRPGANSELHVVDERIAGHMPESLDFAAAAALPLTSVTAWELLFDRLKVPREGGAGETLLVIGAAGGVGSILVQLARQLTKLTIVGTASRPETRDWVLKAGAHHVIDHSKPLSEELKAIGIPQAHHIASLTQTDLHFLQIVEAIAPQGQLALIDDPQLFDFRLLKPKSVSLHWERMFTRSMYRTEDMVRQHEILEEVAKLVDAGVLKTTVGENLGVINAENLRKAHVLIESGRARGKVVLAGF